MLSADDQPHDNDSLGNRHRLPKWPFFFGDAVLVIAALAVWLSAGGLSASQMFFCLGAVALGAVIFVTPYALEHFFPIGGIFAGERSSSELAGEGEWRQQARAATEAVEHAARANAALESSARRFDARFAPLVEIHQGLAAVAAELREATAARASAEAGESVAVQREFERLRKDQAEKLKALEEKVAVIGDAIAVLASHLNRTNPPRPVPSANPVAAATRAKEPPPEVTQNAIAARVAEPVLAGVVMTEQAIPRSSLVPAVSVVTEETSSPPVTAAAEIAEAPSLGAITLGAGTAILPPDVDSLPGEEKSMLAKAFARAQSSGQTPAVAGIIMARARRPRKTKSPVPIVTATPEVAAEPPTPDISESAATLPTPVEREGWQSLSEGKFDSVMAGETAVMENESSGAAPAPVVEPSPVNKVRPATSDTSSAFRRSARAKAIALRGEAEEAAAKDTPVVFAPGRSDGPGAVVSDGPTQGELLAREAETIRKRRSSRSPVQACSLTARVLIGIGNKPFVRGIGPGLSQEKGVPMEFVEIGQWRWVAPDAVKEPISLRILKNDEVPAEGEVIVLHPGQSLEVSPQFSTGG